MNLNYLSFEQPIAELDNKINELSRISDSTKLNIQDELSRLKKKRNQLIQSIFSSLDAHQIVQIARHPLRPHTIDYIDQIFTDFHELHGDRHGDQAPNMICGLATLGQHPVAIIGHEKGRNTKEKVARNFGMASPQGFRKALRVMKLAEKFQLPILCFIDTPGAYPGIKAEEHNQSEAIARNLFEMSRLKTPIICIITGEGCSGGALGIGVGDHMIMLQYSYFSVISPEGCASILWKDAAMAAEAAEALNLTAPRLLELGLIDEVINEPLGGAHRDIQAISESIKTCLSQHLESLCKQDTQALLKARHQKIMGIGNR